MQNQLSLLPIISHSHLETEEITAKSQPESMAQFLDNLRHQGPLMVCGGHYTWPGAPTVHAIESTQTLLRLSEHLNLSTTLFLDDIGASEACSGTHCNPVLANRFKPIDETTISTWIDQNLTAIESDLANTKQISEHHLASLKNCLTHLNPPLKNHLTIKRLLSALNAKHFESTELMEGFLEDLETLIYLCQRKAFRPLLLTYQIGKILPQVVFERSMSNASSRQLHKLSHKPRNTGLLLTEDQDSLIYSVPAEIPNEQLELRWETRSRQVPFRAANKCSALLAQLFFKLFRGLKKQPSKHLSILYLVPCYDRKRLQNGIWSFLNLYAGDLPHWFGCDSVTVISGFFAHDNLIMLDGITAQILEELEQAHFLNTAFAGKKNWAVEKKFTKFVRKSEW